MATEDASLVFDLSVEQAKIEVPMLEISGAGNSVATTCYLERRGGDLHICIEAEDHDMLSLIASGPLQIAPDHPRIKEDNFLYEEDCIQLALATAGQAQPESFLLVNPLGNVKFSGELAGYCMVHTQRSADGWVINIKLPLTWTQPPVLAISLHRFYRGVNHEVHGLTSTLPHPLNTEDFAIALLEPGVDAAAFRQSLRDAKAAQLENTLQSCRERLGKRKTLPESWTDFAIEMTQWRLRRHVHAGTQFLCWNEGHFQHALINLWQLTGDVVWLQRAIDRMERVWAYTGYDMDLPDKLWDLPESTWYDHRDEAGAAITLITGVILYPMTRLLREVWSDKSLADLRPRLEPWFDRCRRAIAVHDREWIELPDGSGAYLEPYLKGPARVYPRGGSRICPLNRMFFLAMPMLMLGRLLKDDVYIDRVKRMARFFRESMEEDENGAMVWEYETAFYPATGEDISHAACQVRFAELCRAEGIEFTDEDLRAIARTLRENIFLHGDVPCGEVRGLTPSLDMSVGAWSSLCRFVPDVLPRIAAVVETACTERPEFFEKEGWGIYLLTEVEMARQRVL